jgi:hypothetical protein
MTSHRKDASPSTSEQDSTKEPKHRRLTRRQRIIARAASLGGVAVVAFITAFAGNFGSHAATLVSTIRGHSARGSSPTGEPVTIDYVGPEPPAGTAVMAAAAKPIIFTSHQLEQLNSQQNSGSAAEWLAAHGALTPSIDILVVVQGNRAHTVRIVDIQPVAACAQPLHGTVFFSPSAGADPITQLNLNLDKPQVPLSYSETYSVNGSAEEKTIRDYFGHYTVSLDPGKQFTFAIDATTRLHYCKFSLTMTVVDGSQTVMEPITDHGKPFQVTAIYHDGLQPSFSRYSTVYLGGLAGVNQETGAWSRVNPTTAEQMATRD